MGYTAAALIQHKLTALCVSVTNVTQPSTQWRCGGVPLLGLMDDQPKEGYANQTLTVPSDNVDLTAKTFQKAKSQTKQWRIQDRYTNPGPIQFYLDEADENNKIPSTLTNMFKDSDEM